MDANEVNEMNQRVIKEFRENDGRVGGMFEGAPLLLLHTVGAKSGKARINPMMYQKVGDQFAVFASMGGAPTNPAWFHNLGKNPDAEIEVGSQTLPVTAHVADPATRQQIWEAQKANYPQFAEYEARTDREIPVVLLTQRN
ncbi:MAG: nitroreductase family deazaflavin-dependent oxidoreductase [Actinomycetia bacterium]|nr:nitroreductase family deazaflavin-dependent oxidoreductase [Actinomycetes bacterium]